MEIIKRCESIENEIIEVDGNMTALELVEILYRLPPECANWEVLCGGKNVSCVNIDADNGIITITETDDYFGYEDDE